MVFTVEFPGQQPQYHLELWNASPPAPVQIYWIGSSGCAPSNLCVAKPSKCFRCTLRLMPISCDGENQDQKLNDPHLNSVPASYSLCGVGWIAQPVSASVSSSSKLEEYYVYPGFEMKIWKTHLPYSKSSVHGTGLFCAFDYGFITSGFNCP